ncbi:unnamed protein product [Ambrosiozyma monospora]|uniref:Unnamed protein product n=1 Tax=Ambrosiozyma monospora TaxID=43982 RepID=A0A9W7DCP9_AMBMO|nr:unnamed protein product [Ambrosiozyma monospora]
MTFFITKLFREFQTARANGNHLPDLTFEFNPVVTIGKIKSNVTIPHVIHYTFMFSVILFVLIILPIHWTFKLLFVFGWTTILTVPILSQFFNYGLPVLVWVFLFFSSKFIPLQIRPPISVQVLPGMETILYGENLSELLASYTSTFLDLLSWLPYGILHFGLPGAVAILIWLFAPPTTLRRFGFSFGYMNLIGVIIQNLLFSCAPPWYKVLHGLEKANYSMQGSPGGLARIDLLFGFDMYTTTFTNSPLIFGAMPSLHSACASMDALWLSYLFPRLTPVWCLYVFILWFSTMYLTHHYFIDLVVGSCLAVTSFCLVKFTGNLPENPKFCRWSYDRLEFHDIHRADPLNALNSVDFDFAEDELSQSLEGNTNDSFEMTPSTATVEMQALDSSIVNHTAPVKSAPNQNFALDDEDEFAHHTANREIRSAPSAL